eukprot:1311032-Prymnesium_polylepis.1
MCPAEASDGSGRARSFSFLRSRVVMCCGPEVCSDGAALQGGCIGLASSDKGQSSQRPTHGKAQAHSLGPGR